MYWWLCFKGGSLWIRRLSWMKCLLARKWNRDTWSITGVTLFYTHWQLVLTEKMWLILMRSIWKPFRHMEPFLIGEQWTWNRISGCRFRLRCWQMRSLSRPFLSWIWIMKSLCTVRLTRSRVPSSIRMSLQMFMTEAMERVQLLRRR